MAGPIHAGAAGRLAGLAHRAARVDAPLIEQFLASRAGPLPGIRLPPLAQHAIDLPVEWICHARGNDHLGAARRDTGMPSAGRGPGSRASEGCRASGRAQRREGKLRSTDGHIQWPARFVNAQSPASFPLASVQERHNFQGKKEILVGLEPYARSSQHKARMSY